MVKSSTMRISISLDLSSRSCIPLPRTIFSVIHTSPTPYSWSSLSYEDGPWFFFTTKPLPWWHQILWDLLTIWHQSSIYTFYIHLVCERLQFPQVLVLRLSWHLHLLLPSLLVFALSVIINTFHPLLDLMSEPPAIMTFLNRVNKSFVQNRHWPKLFPYWGKWLLNVSLNHLNTLVVTPLSLRVLDNFFSPLVWDYKEALGRGQRSDNVVIIEQLIGGHCRQTTSPIESRFPWTLCTLEKTKQRRQSFSWVMDCDFRWWQRPWPFFVCPVLLEY